MKQYAVRVLTIFFILLGLGLALLTMIHVWQVNAGGNLPSVSYLGDSGTFNVGPGHNFIVKQLRPFRFVSFPGPEYTARADERVWSVQGVVDVPAAEVGITRVLGSVEAGCLIDYVTIDDDVDDRVNYFLLDDEIIHVMGQGLTTRGRFMIERSGVLSYRANDSIGAFVSVCEESVTLTPPPTLTPTATLTPTETPSITMTPTATVTGTLTATPTTTPVILTPTAEPDVATETPIPSPTPTSEPRLPSCLRINFDVSGDEARRGLYIAQEVGGRFLAGWEADDGWKDSGWFYDIDITFPAVYAQVLYYHGPGVEPVIMKIVNPAPDTEHGWLARGMCHALEVGWP
jgi:hypothetical protein